MSESKYEYMLGMEHPTSKVRKRMSMEERAAQFGAFRALTGLEEEIGETARLTESRPEADDYTKQQVDRVLVYIADSIRKKPEILIEYFVQDKRKPGGAILTYRGRVKKIRENAAENGVVYSLVFEDETEIEISDILGAEIIE